MKHLKLSKSNTNESGYVLISAVLVVVVLMVIGFSLISSSNSQYSLTKQNTYANNAILTAEAGAEQSLQQLNQDDNFAGFSTAQTFFDNATQGKAVYTTTVTTSPTDANAKVITSTAKVYRKSGAPNPASTRIVKVTVVGTSSPGYAVQSGPGGLILGGSASITNAQVYVNGTLTLNGTAKIGTSGQPLSVNVANQACPAGATPGSTYPTVCTSSQPISLAYSTNIYGTVCATGQTSTGPNNNIKGGSTGSGLKPGCTAPPVSTPTYDRTAHINRMTTSATSTDNNYVCQNSPFNRTWPANLKLTGNVSIASSCNVVIKGDAYITGNLDIGGASKITVDDSVGTTRPVIVVDGKITVGGSAQLIANASGTGIQFVSFKSTNSCTTAAPASACATITGNDLKSSSALETVDVGGAANLPGMIFDAYWGKITLGGSGTLGSAIGQTIDMSGAGTVTFGTTLSSGSHTWTVTSYQQKYPGKP